MKRKCFRTPAPILQPLKNWEQYETETKEILTYEMLKAREERDAWKRIALGYQSELMKFLKHPLRERFDIG